MTWQQLLLIGLIIISSLVTISTVGQTRKVTTPNVAAITVAINAIIILLIASI